MLYKHGKAKRGVKRIPEYGAWLNMKSRCYQPSAPKHPIYIRKKIIVCNRWLHNFSAFFADMGKRPSRKYSLDRINNDGDYEPGNCRWATSMEQSHNSDRWKNHKPAICRIPGCGKLGNRKGLCNNHASRACRIRKYGPHPYATLR